MPVRLEFGDSDSEEDERVRKLEEEKKNVEMNKETINDRKQFPTLGQANKIMAAASTN
jgi:hypothetical protein